MRRRIVLLLVVVAALAMVGGVALAVDKSCGGGDCVGTREDDTITGSNSPDRIAGMEGNDTITQPQVFGDSDEIYGDEGNDTITDIIADADRDTIYGDEGNDTIDVRDGDLGPDFVDCGPGKKDKVFFNPEDTVVRCEIKKPGYL